MSAQQFKRSASLALVAAGLGLIFSTTAIAASEFQRGPAPTVESLSTKGLGLHH